MKMRELEAQTGVNRETIRVYLRLGLIPQPIRPNSRTAIYGEEHVAAIASVKRLQYESRLTLPEIQAILAGKTPAVNVDAGAFSQLERLVASKVGIDDRYVTVGSLTDRAAYAEADAQVLHDLGIVQLVKSDQGDTLSLTDAQLVLIWGEMRLAGFVEDINYTPAILKFYVEATEFVAGWEAKTFLERTVGRVDVDTAATMIQRALPLMLNFFGLMRQKAFMRDIEKAGVPGGEPPAPATISPSLERP